jgi:Glycosyl transferases group 1
MEKHLHIVCLDVPYPVDYGGVFDLFYKIETLSRLGIKLHLHCFEYGRGEQPELNRYCESVHYYPRQQGHKGFSHKLPYIVCSRSNSALLENLLHDDYPILLEGVHCSFLLTDERFSKRRIFLRLHNIEYKYYRQLYRTERNLFKKIYYLHESWLLKRYEKKIADKAFVIAVSEQDCLYYRKEFGAERANYLPVFLPYQRIQCKETNGCYCLYHGNLSVSENESAAIWLMKHIFHDLQIPFVVAGKNPSARLQRQAQQHAYTCLVANPSGEEMQDIISKAQIHILPSFNNTGIKLKLMNALFNGRHCIVNEETVKDTGLESLCHIADGERSYKKLIRQLYDQPFEQNEVLQRKNLLLREFDNEKNGKQLITWIW